MRWHKKMLRCLLIICCLLLGSAGVQVQAAQKNTLTFKSSYSKIVLKKGSKKTLYAQYNGKTLKSSKLVWKSSRTSVVTVKNGVLTAKKNGTATVTAKWKVGRTYKTASIKIVVGTPVTLVQTNAASGELAFSVGDRYRLRPSISPSNATIKTVTYSSSNKKVVTVSSKGLIKAVAPGSAQITVKSTDGSGKYRKIRVYVAKKKTKASEKEALKTFQWIAHRGSNQQAPENTLPAFEIAAKTGFRALECDVRETKDGQIVVCHDASLLKMCGVDIPIAELTLEQVRSYPVTGGSNAGDYENLRIATFEEFIQCCNQYGCTPVVEVKSVSSALGLQNLYKQLTMAKKAPVVIAFSDKPLLYLRKLDKKISLQKISSTYSTALLKKCKKYDWDISTKYTQVNASIIKTIHKAGLKVSVWLVDNSNIARLYRSWNVDYITVDRKLF